MQICKVVGHVWASKKEEALNGLKLMVVEKLDIGKLPTGEVYVAADVVGAGIGEQVMTVWGSAARKAVNDRADQTPIDCAIVAIIDNLEIE